MSIKGCEETCRAMAKEKDIQIRKSGDRIRLSFRVWGSSNKSFRLLDSWKEVLEFVEKYN